MDLAIAFCRRRGKMSGRSPFRSGRSSTGQRHPDLFMTVKPKHGSDVEVQQMRTNQKADGQTGDRVKGDDGITVVGSKA
ncbi:hypothetical protein HJFPF1_06350 [Paramyrothecium foliicola]|nr:hypothetical protein HJFPF1_06350 [Paramyrothecium foliicola]